VKEKFSPLFEPIQNKRTKPREFIRRVNVFFDDVKHEVIKATKAPDGNDQKRRDTRGKVFQQQAARGQNAREQKQKAFKDNQLRAFNIAEHF
jgi:hypothetical protein